MSKVNIWWPMYPADFAADTSHLTNEEIGVLVKLLNKMWREGGSISSDTKYLSKLVGVSSRKWKSLDESLMPMFIIKDGIISNKRLSEELVKAKSSSEKKSQNAIIRWEKERAKQCNSNANASEDSMQMQCSSPSPSSSPPQNLPVFSPDDVLVGDIAFTEDEVAEAARVGGGS